MFTISEQFFKIFISNPLSSLLPNLSTCTWNFNEVGHGKDAPNCVGTALKQAVDKVEREGHIENFDKLMPVLKIKCIQA